MNLIALNIPSALSVAIEREAAKQGLSAAAWIVERLAERFGLPMQEPSS